MEMPMDISNKVISCENSQVKYCRPRARKTRTADFARAAQSKRTWTCHKSHYFARIYRQKSRKPDGAPSTLIKHRPWPYVRTFQCGHVVCGMKGFPYFFHRRCSCLQTIPLFSMNLSVAVSGPLRFLTMAHLSTARTRWFGRDVNLPPTFRKESQPIPYHVQIGFLTPPLDVHGHLNQIAKKCSLFSLITMPKIDFL